MGKLDGRIALITGGTTGIGFATAKLFQQEGARIVITGRGGETLARARHELGPGALAVQADSSKLEDVTLLIGEIREKFGRIDVIFANAGIAKALRFENASEELFDELFNTNVKGLFFLLQRALPLMKDGGAIVLNASVAGRKGIPGYSVYAATKAAVRSLGRTLAAELAPRRIRVNTVSPGPIRTPIFTRGRTPDEIEQTHRKMSDAVALKRMGTPEEIARAVLFLASDDSSYAVGAELLVDGGFGEL